MAMLLSCHGRMCQWDSVAGSYDTSRPGWIKCSDRAKERRGWKYQMDVWPMKRGICRIWPTLKTKIALTYASGWWAHGLWSGEGGCSMWFGWWSHFTSIAHVFLCGLKSANERESHPLNTKHPRGGCESGKMNKASPGRWAGWECYCMATGMTRTYKNVHYCTYLYKLILQMICVYI